MLTFREFLLNEQPTVMFDGPVDITVDIDGKAHHFTLDLIDVRAEDWDATQVRTGSGVVMQSAPKTLSGFQPFSLPIVGGFINHDTFDGNKIGPEATTRTIVRKDWAKFANFLLGDKVVKAPVAMRSYDKQVG